MNVLNQSEIHLNMLRAITEKIKDNAKFWKIPIVYNNEKNLCIFNHYFFKKNFQMHPKIS